MSTQEIPTPDQQNQTAIISTQTFEGKTNLSMQVYNNNVAVVSFPNNEIDPIVMDLNPQALNSQISAIKSVLTSRSETTLIRNSLRSSIIGGFKAHDIAVRRNNNELTNNPKPREEHPARKPFGDRKPATKSFGEYIREA